MRVIGSFNAESFVEIAPSVVEFYVEVAWHKSLNSIIRVGQALGAQGGMSKRQILIGVEVRITFIEAMCNEWEVASRGTQ